MPEDVKKRFPGIFADAAAAAEGLDDTLLPDAALETAVALPGKRQSQYQRISWKRYTIAELIRMRDEITRALPATELSGLNLEQEVLLQYHALRELQGNVMEDETIPVNQRAQVANTVAATLKTLADKQIDLYSSERFKDIENLMVRFMSKMEEGVAEGFIVEYEKILLAHGK